jgi:ATP-dependent Clp protease adaptor protein ClpS
MPGEERKTGGEVLERTKPVIKEPALYQVILHNDDYTTMDFVVEVLEQVFQKHPAEAFRLMLQVHTQGRAVCGMYPFEVAETKVSTVHDRAQAAGFPLRASVEEAS